MTSAEQPDTPPTSATSSETTGIQATVPLPEPSERIPLPPPPQPRQPQWDAAQLSRERGVLDAILVAFVLVFAFLVASFPSSYSDFFRQLATGRLLAQGEYHFGEDPFVYSTDGTYWVNHSWLFALLVYALYQLGGAVVVVFKALLIALVAEFMLRAGRRPGRSLWIPAACTLLALLVVSTRVFLQPICLSYVFLALTLWLLLRPSSSGEPVSARSWWLLPPLFALWVNCDQWFFLGPLTIALYLLGQMIQQWMPPALQSTTSLCRPDAIRLAGVLIVGVAACLLNPHHVRAFTLPYELGLSATGAELENDPQFSAYFISPLRKVYYGDTGIGLSVAGLAYYPLLLLGLGSFGVLYRRLPWTRLTVWLGFALLSFLNYRIAPFFAIVAGPLTALNWLDFTDQLENTAQPLTRGMRMWSLGGRCLTILTVLVLVVLSIPGWLQAQPRHQRRVGWSVRVDPALENAAKAIHGWREANLLPSDVHWFNVHVEVAHYLAWFAPGERAFADQQLPDFAAATEDYLTVRDGIRSEMGDPSAAAAEASADPARQLLRKDWRPVLRKRKAQFVIVDNLAYRKGFLGDPVYFFADPEEWELCYLHGRIAIFAWKDRAAESPTPSTDRLKVDLQRLAFGTDADKAPPPRDGGCARTAFERRGVRFC